VFERTARGLVHANEPRVGVSVRVGEGTVAKEDRGFASMDRNKQRDIASKGGKAAHQKGTAHEWTSEEAREAGRKGGMARHRRKQQQGDGGDTTNTAGSNENPPSSEMMGNGDLG